MSRHRQNTQATREKLLDATAALMVRRHSIDVSLSEIAEESGVNPALVQYHFRGKSGLFLELLRRSLAQRIDNVSILGKLDISPAEKLRLHILAIMRAYAEYPYTNRIFHYLLLDDPARFGPILADEMSRPLIEFQNAVLDEGERLGLFRKVDRMFLYIHILGACDQFAYGHESMRRQFGVESVTEAMWRGYAEHLSTTILNGVMTGELPATRAKRKR